MKFNVWMSLAVLALSSTVMAADTYDLDPVHSQVIFKIRHLGVSNNYGRFNDVSGSFTVDSADVSKSSVQVEIKTESVDTHAQKRDDHLRSPDFFDAKQYPTISFKSTGVKKVDDTSLDVEGDLTIHGVTKKVTVRMAKVGEGPDPWGGFRVGYDGSLTLKRSEFGVLWGIDKNVVGDEVTLFLNFEGVKKQ